MVAGDKVRPEADQVSEVLDLRFVCGSDHGERFYKRWGLWEQFQKDHPPGTDLHTMPKEIKAMQDMQERTAFQQNREEVPT